MAIILNVPGHIGAAGLEALILSKNFPQFCPEQGAFLWAFTRLLGIHTAIVVAYYFIYLGLIYPYLLSPIRHFPTMSMSINFIATRRRLRKSRAPQGQQFLDWTIASENDDGVLLLRGPFSTNRLLLTNTRALADVLVHHTYDFEKPSRIRNFLRTVLGDGLIIIEGDAHRFQRKHAMPAFTFRNIKNLYPMMWRKALQLNDHLSAEALDTNNIDTYSWSSKVTLDIIGIAGMGQELNVLQNTQNELVQCYEQILDPSPDRLIFFLLSVFGPSKLVANSPWSVARMFKTTTATLRRVCHEIVQAKRAAIKSGADDNFDILSLLIKSNDFNDDGLVDQLLTFLAAGHETTSSAFTWLCYLLASRPEAQQRVREEVRNAIPKGTSDTGVDVATVLESLPYLNGICNETLRLYPTVPVTVRTTVRNTTIVGKPVPKGIDVIVSPWATNRNPRLWGETAGDFVPERWITDGKPNNNGGADSNYAQLTFLHGPRSCIGQGFAKAELRCLVAAFVGRFEWEMLDNEKDIVPAGVITIKPKNGLHLKLKEIGGW